MVPTYHCKHYGLVQLSTLRYGTYHCKHYGIVQLSTLGYGTTSVDSGTMPYVYSVNSGTMPYIYIYIYNIIVSTVELCHSVDSTVLYC